MMLENLSASRKAASSILSALLQKQQRRKANKMLSHSLARSLVWFYEHVRFLFICSFVSFFRRVTLKKPLNDCLTCVYVAQKKTFLMSNENGFSMNKVQNWWISFLSLFLIEKKRKNDNKFVSESKRIVMAMIDDTKHEIPVPKIEIYSRQRD